MKRLHKSTRYTVGIAVSLDQPPRLRRFKTLRRARNLFRANPLAYFVSKERQVSAKKFVCTLRVLFRDPATLPIPPTTLSDKTIARITAGLKKHVVGTMLPTDEIRLRLGWPASSTPRLSLTVPPGMLINHDPAATTRAYSAFPRPAYPWPMISPECTSHSLAGPREPRKSLTELAIEDFHQKREAARG